METRKIKYVSEKEKCFLTISDGGTGPDNRYVSFVAEVYNKRGMPRLISSGQSLEYFPKGVQEIWKKYHLDGMSAGTKEQDAEIMREFKWKYPGYEKALAHLEKKGMSPDENGYSYGSCWKFHEKGTATVEEIFNMVSKFIS